MTKRARKEVNLLKERDALLDLECLLGLYRDTLTSQVKGYRQTIFCYEMDLLGWGLKEKKAYLEYGEVYVEVTEKTARERIGPFDVGSTKKSSRPFKVTELGALLKVYPSDKTFPKSGKVLAGAVKKNVKLDQFIAKALQNTAKATASLNFLCDGQNAHLFDADQVRKRIKDLSNTINDARLCTEIEAVMEAAIKEIEKCIQEIESKIASGTIGGLSTIIAKGTIFYELNAQGALADAWFMIPIKNATQADLRQGNDRIPFGNSGIDQAAKGVLLDAIAFKGTVALMGILNAIHPNLGGRYMSYQNFGQQGILSMRRLEDRARQVIKQLNYRIRIAAKWPLKGKNKPSIFISPMGNKQWKASCGFIDITTLP